MWSGGGQRRPRRLRLSRATSPRRSFSSLISQPHPITQSEVADDGLLPGALVRLGDVRIDLRHGHRVRESLPASQDGGCRQDSGGVATARERHVARLVREAGNQDAV